MAIIKCKMCGGDIELAADKTFGTCEYCGNTMTLPKVSDDQRAAAFNRGNHFRRMGEFDKALAVYERIVAEDDNDAEAHWCCALCRFGIEYVEDPATYEWLPTCHRASFDSFLEDVDYLAAVEHSDGITRRQYQKDAAKIAEVQRGILATSQNTEPYDVFISYKELNDKGERTRDSILAQEIYYRLTEKGWRVFFSRISLEDVPGTQYEPYIFAALNSAKVMIVVGTSAENLNAVWVKNEWSRYLSLMRKDRGKLLIPCYRDMDPYDLPEQLSVLMSYDMGKIGFIQDLIRGVDKVLNAEKPKEAAPASTSVQERVIVQQSGGGPNVTALLKRGQQALEDSDWDKARDFFDQVLSMDAENAEAFFGLFLAGENCADENAYIERACAKTGAAETLFVPIARERIDKTILDNAIPDYLADNTLRSLFLFDLKYPAVLANQKRIAEQEKASLEKDRNLNRAFRYAKGETAGRLGAFKSKLLAGLDQKVEQAKATEDAAREAKRAAYEAFLTNAENTIREQNERAQAEKEADYQALCRCIEKAKTISEFSDAKNTLNSRFSGYKGSAEQIRLCEEQISAIAKKAQEEAERQRIIEAEKAKAAAEEAERQRIEKEKAAAAAKAKKKRLGILAVGLAAALLAAALLVWFVIIPGKQYKTAEALLENGDRAQAAIAFARAGRYKDSRERSFEIWEQLAPRRSITAGIEHTVGLKADGTVVAAGNNEYGQCEVSNWTDIVAVAAGSDHTVGLKADGTVIAVGNNDDHQCDVSNWTDIVAVAAGTNRTMGLKADGTVIAVGNNDFDKCEVSNWTDIVAVAAGTNHSVGLKANGTVVAVGKNDFGPCNISNWTDIVAIAAGFNHTVGLKADGTVVAVGAYKDGECFVSNWADIVAVAAGNFHTVGLKADRTVVAVGNNDYHQCEVSNWTDIVAVAAGGVKTGGLNTGSAHTVGIKVDGTVVAVGDNDYGQCDVSDWKDIKVPSS